MSTAAASARAVATGTPEGGHQPKGQSIDYSHLTNCRTKSRARGTQGRVGGENLHSSVDPAGLSQNGIGVDYVTFVPCMAKPGV